MDKIRNFIEDALESPPMMGAVGLVVGILLGIFYAYVLNPVEYVDGAIYQLREDLKVDYLRMTIDSYALNQDAALAEFRYQRLGDEADEILETVEETPNGNLVSDITAFRNVIDVTTATEEMEEEAASRSGGNFLKWALLITVVLAGALVGRYFLLKRSTPEGESKSAATIAQDITSQMETTSFEGTEEGPPMHQFVTTYVLGDNLFDDSFSIESASGEFLGECGVGISEAMGVGEPKRVTAFEVWLFDQNDIKTVTKVLMSGHAYYDEATRADLEKKGEPVLAEPGKEFALTTNNLKVICRVMDMGYGEGPLPEDSFFDRLSIEMSVWPNDGADDEMASGEFEDF